MWDMFVQVSIKVRTPHTQPCVVLAGASSPSHEGLGLIELFLCSSKHKDVMTARKKRPCCVNVGLFLLD